MPGDSDLIADVKNASSKMLKQVLESFQRFSPGGHFTAGLFVGLAIRSKLVSPIALSLGVLTGIYIEQTYDLPRMSGKVEKVSAMAIDYLETLKK